jgi:hypothetical protein
MQMMLITKCVYVFQTINGPAASTSIVMAITAGFHSPSMPWDKGECLVAALAAATLTEGEDDELAELLGLPEPSDVVVSAEPDAPEVPLVELEAVVVVGNSSARDVWDGANPKTSEAVLVLVLFEVDDDDVVAELLLLLLLEVSGPGFSPRTLTELELKQVCAVGSCPPAPATNLTAAQS